MRSVMAGFVVLGLATIGTVTTASARPPSVPPAEPSLAVQRADWDWDRCDSRCQEHRREALEQERDRLTSHRQWEEHQMWQESRYPAAGYQHHY
jgi:hypothetical protein